MNTLGGCFVYAIVGAIVCATIAFYALAAPVAGGAVGAVAGAGLYLLTNRKPQA